MATEIFIRYNLTTSARKKLYQQGQKDQIDGMMFTSLKAIALSIMIRNIKQIAILRALYLGDMLCVIPAVRAIRFAYPSASITLIGLPWQRNFAARFNNYFDNFIEFPGWPGLPEQKFDPVECVAFMTTMQERQFDLVMQMQGNGEVTNALCMLFGARAVCGLRKTGEYCPNTTLFPVSDDSEHEVLRFLKLADALNVPRQGDELEFNFMPDEIRRGGDMLDEIQFTGGKFFCLHPGARDPRRRWPVENFARVADKLVAHGYDILLTGSADEHELLSGVRRHMGSPAVDLVEKFGNVGIGELSYMISKSAGLLSNDTGVSHIASALHIPSVIIFSSFSHPQRWAPLDSVVHKTILPEQSSHLQLIVNSCLEAVNAVV